MKDKPDSLDKELSSIFYQYDAEKNQGLNELAGHGTAVEQAVAQLKAIIQREVLESRIDELHMYEHCTDTVVSGLSESEYKQRRYEELRQELAYLNGGKK